MSTESQTKRILDLFKKEKSVTNAQLNTICFRYGARIHELRNDGYIIVTNRLGKGLFSFHYKGHVEDKVLEFAD
jgi:hypothetical protein